MPAAHRIPKTSPVYSFLSRCDSTVEIYVTHIDTSNVAHRKGRFLTLLGVNITFFFLLVRRILGGLSRYGVLYLLGKLVSKSSAPAQPPHADKWLFGNILLDLFIFSVLVPIVLDFVTGLATLRFRYGFPREEIVFRRPTLTTKIHIAIEEPEKRDAYLRNMLQRAVDREEMKQPKFGMPWEEWAYDYRAMAAACEASKRGTVHSNTWELSVWMKMTNGWSVIQHGQEDDYETQVGMLEKLRDKLQDMDKVHVFQQMMEVVQTRTVPQSNGRATVADDVDAIVADIFKQNDLDFATMMGDIAMDVPPSFERRSKKDD